MCSVLETWTIFSTPLESRCSYIGDCCINRKSARAHLEILIRENSSPDHAGIAIKNLKEILCVICTANKKTDKTLLLVLTQRKMSKEQNICLKKWHEGKDGWLLSWIRLNASRSSNKSFLPSFINCPWLLISPPSNFASLSSFVFEFLPAPFPCFRSCETIWGRNLIIKLSSKAQVECTETTRK